MLVHIYSLFDSVAKEHIRTLYSKDDATAERSCEYIVREPNFDKIRGKDLVLCHAYDFDTETGKVSNNDVRTICSIASKMAAFEVEQATEREQAIERRSEDGTKGSRKKA